MRQASILALVIVVLAGSGAAQGSNPAAGFMCAPTPEDELGPLYQPGAAVRNTIGAGYLLFGELRSAKDCSAIPQAKIEIWMAGPEGLYGENWRATLFSADNGRYYLQSHRPPGYGTGRPHIHIKVSAEGFAPLITQHYPVEGAGEALFDLVLIPLEK